MMFIIFGMRMKNQGQDMPKFESYDECVNHMKNVKAELEHALNATKALEFHIKEVLRLMPLAPTLKSCKYLHDFNTGIYLYSEKTMLRNTNTKEIQRLLAVMIEDERMSLEFITK